MLERPRSHTDSQDLKMRWEREEMVVMDLKDLIDYAKQCSITLDLSLPKIVRRTTSCR